VRLAAVCAFASGIGHLDRLPAAQPWTRPAALVLLGGLPGQPPGVRAVLMRPTREALARRAVAEAIAAGEAQPLDRRLAPLPAAGAAHAAYLALFVPPPADAGATAACALPGPRP
jgi:hypothetical protein